MCFPFSFARSEILMCVCSGQVLAATQGRTVAVALGSDVVEQDAVKQNDSRDSNKATG
jgi:hypothetical protein